MENKRQRFIPGNSEPSRKNGKGRYRRKTASVNTTSLAPVVEIFDFTDRYGATPESLFRSFEPLDYGR
ncbi:hypothetical protein HF324_21265 [Chitinophaga oryzae]|uniref:Uncharacterized protein n=1 Tax=Chitinophaga oryzae TaxID=2725414 RepID=A0ABX6LKI7_9BACT|nr:hypothetical protein [Chitinophaga oryzae]QJB40249.1 hypothetical protein HF324_21265 [Chitinophaga oryzae]